MSRAFRLQALERLRTSTFERATASLGGARRALAQAELNLETLEQAVIACVPRPRATPEDVQAAAAHRNLLRDRADTARTDVSQARTDLQSMIGAWHRARADLRAVENLHERHLTQLAAQDAHREQRLSDDLAATVLRFPGLTRVRSGGPAGHNDPNGGEAA